MNANIISLLEDIDNPYNFFKAISKETKNTNKKYIIFSMWEDSLVTNDYSSFKNTDSIYNKEIIDLIKDIVNNDNCLSFYIISQRSCSDLNRDLKTFVNEVKRLNLFDVITPRTYNIFVLPKHIDMLNDGNCIVINNNTSPCKIINFIMSPYIENFMEYINVYLLIGNYLQLGQIQYDIDLTVQKSLTIYFLPNNEEKENLKRDIKSLNSSMKDYVDKLRKSDKEMDEKSKNIYTNQTIQVLTKLIRDMVKDN